MPDAMQMLSRKHLWPLEGMPDVTLERGEDSPKLLSLQGYGTKEATDRCTGFSQFDSGQQRLCR
jgi:hypothetical protein